MCVMIHMYTMKSESKPNNITWAGIWISNRYLKSNWKQFSLGSVQNHRCAELQTLCRPDDCAHADIYELLSEHFLLILRSKVLKCFFQDHSVFWLLSGVEEPVSNTHYISAWRFRSPWVIIIVLSVRSGIKLDGFSFFWQALVVWGRKSELLSVCLFPWLCLRVFCQGLKEQSQIFLLCPRAYKPRESVKQCVRTSFSSANHCDVSVIRCVHMILQKKECRISWSSFIPPSRCPCSTSLLPFITHHRWI